MRYETDGKLHTLTFDKDEMITAVALLNEGLEYMRVKMEAGDKIAEMKYKSGKALLDELNQRIMEAQPKERQ